MSLRNAPLHHRNVAWRHKEKMAVQETIWTLVKHWILRTHFQVLKVFEKVKRWQVRLFEIEFAERWILLAQSILRPWNSSCGTCFTRWFCFYFKVWQTGGILLMMPCFDLVDWKCKLKSVRFYITFIREKKSLRHVAMVAKFPDLNKQWSCKYGRKKIDMTVWLSCAWLHLQTKR